jgi:hypothetical protein
MFSIPPNQGSKLPKAFAVASTEGARRSKCPSKVQWLSRVRSSYSLQARHLSNRRCSLGVSSPAAPFHRRARIPSGPGALRAPILPLRLRAVLPLRPPVPGSSLRPYAGGSGVATPLPLWEIECRPPFRGIRGPSPPSRGRLRAEFVQHHPVGLSPRIGIEGGLEFDSPISRFRDLRASW